MSRRKTHYDPGGGGSPFDDGDEYVYCGTALLEGDFTGKEGMVTCKRCLNAMAARSARIAKEMEPRKAELYDEVWSLARSLGWMNITDAITQAGAAGDFYHRLRKERP
jgi:hypothetical protein